MAERKGDDVINGVVFRILCIHPEENGKVYIGATLRVSNVDKWYKNYQQGDYPINRVLRRYGRKYFRVGILRFAATRRELASMQIDEIRHYDSTNPDKGFNMRPTGGLFLNSREMIELLMSKGISDPDYYPFKVWKG